MERDEEGQVPEIDVHDLEDRLEGALVVDVRDLDEHLEARVPGVRHIPLATVPDFVSSLPTDQTVYVICATGSRSLVAAEYLRSVGIDAVNVAGGTKGWIAAGKPTDHGPAAAV